MGVSNTEVAVLDRHLEATERDHLGTMSEVKLVEAGFAKGTSRFEFRSSIRSYPWG